MYSISSNFIQFCNKSLYLTSIRNENLTWCKGESAVMYKGIIYLNSILCTREGRQMFTFCGQEKWNTMVLMGNLIVKLYRTPYLTFSKNLISYTVANFKAEFRSMERSVDGMKLHWDKYSRDFIPYNLPQLCQEYEILEQSTRTRISDLCRPDQVC